MTALKTFTEKDVNIPIGQISSNGVAKLYEVDFTTLPNQDLTAGGDGDVTIDERTWYVANTGAATTFDILNGTGLRIFPDATATFWTGGNRTAPLVGIRLPDISKNLPALSAAPASIRFWIKFSSNHDQNSERFSFGTEMLNDLTSGRTFLMERGQFSGVDSWRWNAKVGTTAEDSTATNNSRLSDDVMMIRVDGNDYEFWTGQSVNGDFPAEKDMVRRAFGTVTLSQGVTQWDLLEQFAEWGIAWSAGPNNTNGNYQVTVTKFKVDAVGIPAIRDPGITSVLDIDFTAEPTQDLKAGGDGNKTIAGKTFYVDNTANADTLAITNGTGLQFDAAAVDSRLWSSGVRTGAIFGIETRKLGINWSDVPFVRAWIVVSALNLPTNQAERLVIGFENQQSGTNMMFWQGGQQRNGSGNLSWSPAFVYNGAGNGPTFNETGAADDVWMIQLDSNGDAIVYSGQSVGGEIPDMSAMTARGNIQIDGATNIWNIAEADMAVAIAMDTFTAAGTATATITKMRVDVPSNVVVDPSVNVNVISPPQITVNTNDYEPTGFDDAEVLRLSTDASRNLTGAKADPTRIRKTIINVGSNDLVIKHQDAGSLATNRFLNFTGADITLGADDWAHLFYDVVTQRWRVTT
ncbi:MAG: hypothetical protein R3212_04215 [Xanthomonadales bacterium]|nr:hypothetical protein [Xanthomonadales bacterium]